MTKIDPVPAQGNWRIQRQTQGDRIMYSFPARTDRPIQDGKQNKIVREAVFAHIKALRKLGQTRVNTREIAAALKLPNAVVEQAAAQLKEEGVKLAK